MSVSMYYVCMYVCMTSKVLIKSEEQFGSPVLVVSTALANSQQHIPILLQLRSCSVVHSNAAKGAAVWPLEDVRIIREYLLCIHRTLLVMTMLHVYRTQSVLSRRTLRVEEK